MLVLAAVAHAEDRLSERHDERDPHEPAIEPPFAELAMKL
jgi:hypothetical protein